MDVQAIKEGFFPACPSPGCGNCSVYRLDISSWSEVSRLACIKKTKKQSTDLKIQAVTTSKAQKLFQRKHYNLKRGRGIQALGSPFPISMLQKIRAQYGANKKVAYYYEI